jgi:hypothetical protein
VVGVINTITKIDGRGMFEEHIITVNLVDEIVECAAYVNNKELPTNFVLGHHLTYENAFSALRSSVQ